MDRAQRLIDELEAARADLFDALGVVEPASLTTGGLVGDWSARELVAHLGYWAGYAVEIIHAAEQGRAEEVYASRPAVDDLNETVARVARATDLATVRRREAASVEALVEQLRRMDPSLLATAVSSGYPLEAFVRSNAGDHYGEHAEELRRTLAGRGS